MVLKRFGRAVASAVILAGLVNPARANDGDIIGGLVAGMIGAAIVNGANQQQSQRQVARKPQASGLSSAERQRNAEVQTALNHFGFAVGAPDGVLGSRSRAAIAQYQSFLSFAPTGSLLETERQILITAYQRAMIGGAEVAEIVSASPMGLRGLLTDTRDRMLGLEDATARTVRAGYGGLPPEIAEAVEEIARNSGIEGPVLAQRAGFLQMADMNGDGRSDYLMDTAVTGSGFWCTGKECAVRVFLTTPTGFQRNDFQLATPTPAAFACAGDVCRIAAAPAAPPPAADAPLAGGTGTVMATTPAGQAEPSLPGFAAALPVADSMAAHCRAVGEAAALAGGRPQTAAAMTDPAQALGEQFCQVAAAAEADGAALMAQVQGFSRDQIAAQCAAFSDSLAAQRDMAAAKPRDAALSELQGWLAKAGLPEAQLVGTARICLSVGYGADDVAMALGSALVLTGTGNMVYAELVGHHLAAGLGIARNPALAVDWFDGAVEAAKAGQAPVFLPDQADRLGLVTRAASALAGRAQTPLLPVIPVSTP